MVPHGYEVDPSFAEWIHRQRTTYASMLKEKIPNPMVLDRMNKLDELGFNFTVHSDKWMDHWMLLKEYKEKHGHCQVPTHYVENPRLGRWTHTQRHQRRLQQRGKKSCTTPERIALLDELGFSWEVRAPVEQPRATWHQRCDELKKFHQIHNHFLVPAETHPKLHVWCHEQKNRLKKLDESGRDSSRRMGPARVHTLQELGFTKDTPLADVQRINEAEMTTVPEVNEPMAQTVAVDVAVDDHAAAAALPAAFRDRLDEPLAAAAGEAADDDHAVSETVDALRAVNDTVEAAVNEQMDTTTGNKTTTNDLTHFV